ncbi:MAG: hypothetical protein COW42_15365 [Deltaproteobacteria bacterium CG17_big_fil_post_rev_8_21_14_2_50_63_7]|nr:MAG: hypothetical protein COW42_15365 [Deltaproteobacteria bacterium CG17_big_fil_post_rev_8_21_14_2_50_63_7]
MLQVAVDVDALGTAEQLRGWLAGSGPEDLKAAHGLTFGGPYEVALVAFESGERERIVLRNLLRKDASALVETLVAVPSVEVGDVMGVVRLLSSVAGSTGPWAEAGFAAPAGMTWGQLQALLEAPSVLTYAPGLWLGAAPSLGLRAVPEPMRTLDLAGDYSLQVIVENDFTPQTMKATLVVFGPSGKGTPLLTSLGCLSKGQPLGGDCVALDQNQGVLPIGGVDTHYGVEETQGQTKLVLSGAEELVAGYLSAKSATVDAASVELFALRVDLAKLLASGIFPVGADMEGLDKMVTGKAELTVTLSPKDLEFKFEVGKKGTLLGMQAAIAIPAFAKYLRQAKEAEPLQNLRDIAEGVTVYVETERFDANGAVIPPTFPLSVDLSCAEPMDDFIQPQGVFADLGFGPRKTLYQYCYRTSEDGLRFAAGARADLDGDGLVDSAFCVRGMMNEGYPYLQMPEKTPVDGACIP